ncbi:MAG: hypothetical protein D6725_09475 [Planctomycetota bacterium]|nr:MAG: hypothetical protein D6725_09475 [Planctomycetota bacterium]
MSQAADRIDLLITMTSGDAIVLAKTVHTLQPRHVLLFSTPHARERGWEDSARRVLKSVEKRGRKLIDRYTIGLLHGDSLEEQFEGMRQAIAQVMQDSNVPQGIIAFDATTGPGFLRMLGYEACRQKITSDAGSLRIVYCDGDMHRIVIAEPTAGTVTIRSQPITFRFSTQRDHVTERFSIYGVEVGQADQLWPITNATTARNEHEAHVALYHELCRNERLRALFHSYWGQMNAWRTARILQRELSPDHLERFIADAVRSSAARIIEEEGRRCRNPEELRQWIEQRLLQALCEYVGEAGDTTKKWLDRYLQDRQLGGLRRYLMSSPRESLLQMLRGAKLRGPDTERATAKALRDLYVGLQAELNALAVKAGATTAPDATPPSDHHAFRKDVLQFELPANVRGLLLQNAPKVAELFEKVVAAAVVHMIENDAELRACVDSVWQNVILRRAGDAICELDTLVLLRSGDLAVIEVKTHHKSSEQKKIESNIKQLRDFGGAYSRYALVYPLTASEIKLLRSADPDYRARMQALGMDDAAEWGAHLHGIENSRDRRAVPLERLADELRLAAGLPLRS